MYVSLCACLVKQAFMDVGYIKHHHQPLISYSLYVVIDNFVDETHTMKQLRMHQHTDGELLSSCRYVRLSVRANV